MAKPFRLLLLCAVFLFLAAGCQATNPTPAEHGAYHLTDSLGRELTIRESGRVAAGMGGFADIWLLSGGDLVAVTEDAISERALPLSDDITNLGFYTTPNLEALLEASPDLVLLSSETPSHISMEETLGHAGITAAYFNVTHFADYLAMLDICTDLTGRKDLYETYGLQVGDEIDTLLAATPKDQAPTVLLMITHSGGTAVQNGDTMTGRMLRELGAVNLADRNPSLLRDMSMEYILEEDPDYIFIIPMGNSVALAQQHLETLVEGDPAWQSLQAVQHGRLLLLPKEGFLYKPNANWAESYRYLAEALYE